MENGESMSIAHMLTMQQSPQMGKSDRAFNERAYHRMSNMNTDDRRAIQKTAAKAGIATDGKYYVGGLGMYDDPAAWVSTTEDILHAAKVRNLTVTGGVEHKGRPMQPKRIPLADDLVAEGVRNVLKSEPKTVEKLKNGKIKMEGLRERVIAHHGSRRKG